MIRTDETYFHFNTGISSFTFKDVVVDTDFEIVRYTLMQSPTRQLQEITLELTDTFSPTPSGLVCLANFNRLFMDSSFTGLKKVNVKILSGVWLEEFDRACVEMSIGHTMRSLKTRGILYLQIG